MEEKQPTTGYTTSLFFRATLHHIFFYTGGGILFIFISINRCTLKQFCHLCMLSYYKGQNIIGRGLLYN